MQLLRLARQVQVTGRLPGGTNWDSQLCREDPGEKNADTSSWSQAEPGNTRNNFLLFRFSSPRPLCSIKETSVQTQTQRFSGTLKVKVLVGQSCPTLCHPMDCTPPASSVYEIFRARTLEWVAIPFSRGTSQPKDRTWVSHTAVRFFAIWAIREPCGILVHHILSLLVFPNTVAIPCPSNSSLRFIDFSSVSSSLDLVTVPGLRFHLCGWGYKCWKQGSLISTSSLHASVSSWERQFDLRNSPLQICDPVILFFFLIGG